MTSTWEQTTSRSRQARVGYEVMCPEEQITVDGMVGGTLAAARRSAKEHNERFQPAHTATTVRVIIVHNPP